MNTEAAKNKLTAKARTILENGSVFVYCLDGLFGLATTDSPVGLMGYRTLKWLGTDKMPLKELYRAITEYAEAH